MTDTAARLPFPLPPVIFLVALIVGIGLDIVYPLPWFGDVLGDILFGFGWLAALGAVALWFTAIRMMFRAKTPLNPVAMPTQLFYTTQIPVRSASAATRSICRWPHSSSASP